MKGKVPNGKKKKKKTTTTLKTPTKASNKAHKLTSGKKADKSSPKLSPNKVNSATLRRNDKASRAKWYAKN
jgi:hypothetical protein